MTAPASASVLERQRVDKWLWHARVVRTREAASALTRRGHVRVNGTRITAPSHSVRPGDVLTIALDRLVRVLRVRGFAERRGGSDSAAALYEELTSRPTNTLELRSTALKARSNAS